MLEQNQTHLFMGTDVHAITNIKDLDVYSRMCQTRAQRGPYAVLALVDQEARMAARSLVDCLRPKTAHLRRRSEISDLHFFLTTRRRFLLLPELASA